VQKTLLSVADGKNGERVVSHQLAHRVGKNNQAGTSKDGGIEVTKATGRVSMPRKSISIRGGAQGVRMRKGRRGHP